MSVFVCVVHSVLQFTGVPSMVYLHLMPSVPEIGSGFTTTLTEGKGLTEDDIVKYNEPPQ